MSPSEHASPAPAPDEDARTLAPEKDARALEEIATEHGGHEARAMMGAKAINFGPSLRRLLGLLSAYRGRMVVVMVLAAIGVAANVVGPKILGRATDYIVAGVVGKQLPSGFTREQMIAMLHQQGKEDFAKLLETMPVVPGHGIDFGALGGVLGLALGFFVVAATLTFLQGWLLNTVVQRSMYDLRRTLNEKIDRLPLDYFDTQPRGELISRMTNDIDNIVQTLQQSLQQMMNSILMLVGVGFMMFWVSWQLALVTMVIIPVSGVAAALIGKRAQKQFVGMWGATGMLNQTIEEAYSGHSLVKVFGRQNEVSAVFGERNTELRQRSFGGQFLSGLMMPVMFFIGNINYVVVAVMGGLRVASGQMPIGDVQAFIQYSRMFTQPITQLASMANLLQSSVASAERVFQVLDADEMRPESSTPPAVVERVGAEPDRTSGGDTATVPETAAALGRQSVASGQWFGTVRGQVRFEHVNFSYLPDRPLIRDLSFEAEPGQTVAIVGPTGAGKTTLVNLLMRFYELNGGRILLDGVDIATVPRRILRNNFGMVLQDTWLFNGTIRENIRYGRPDATDDEVQAAAEATFVDRFVHSLPDRYDTVIDAEGSNISAGEKQLITIARAFLADPAILILDEATSSVDTRTELLLQQAMNKVLEGRTSFVIAHRLSTIRDADLILVMRDGAIVEQGNHQQLITAGGAYHDLYQAQFRAATDPDADTDHSGGGPDQGAQPGSGGQGAQPGGDDGSGLAPTGATATGGISTGTAPAQTPDGNPDGR